MSRKCEYCGNYYDGGGCFSYFRENINSQYLYTYHFCCRGHFDSFCNQTSMAEVNEKGLTSDEQLLADRDKTHRKCDNCGVWFKKGTGIGREGYSFCRKECLDDFFIIEGYFGPAEAMLNLAWSVALEDSNPGHTNKVTPEENLYFNTIIKTENINQWFGKFKCNRLIASKINEK